MTTAAITAANSESSASTNRDGSAASIAGMTRINLRLLESVTVKRRRADPNLPLPVNHELGQHSSPFAHPFWPLGKWRRSQGIHLRMWRQSPMPLRMRGGLNFLFQITQVFPGCWQSELLRPEVSEASELLVLGSGFGRPLWRLRSYLWLQQRPVGGLLWARTRSHTTRSRSARCCCRSRMRGTCCQSRLRCQCNHRRILRQNHNEC